MKLETGTNVHESGGSDYEKIEREFITLKAYNNFQQDAPMEVTLHNCLIDGENAMRFRAETNEKYKDKLMLFLDVFDDEGAVEHIILRDAWGKTDAFNKKGKGSPFGTELRKILLVDPNETEHPKIKQEFLNTPFWIKKYVVKGQGSSYHMCQVGFEEGVEIPDAWQPFFARLDGLCWGDLKEQGDPYEWLVERKAQFDADRGASSSDEPSGQTETHEAPHEPVNQTASAQSGLDPSLTEAAMSHALGMVRDNKPVTVVASTLAEVFGIGTADAMKMAVDAYNKFNGK